MSHTLVWFTIIDNLEYDSPQSIEFFFDKKAEVYGESDENAERFAFIGYRVSKTKRVKQIIDVDLGVCEYDS